MGWGNPPVSWSEMERLLSGRPSDGPSLQGRGNGTRKAIQGDAAQRSSARRDGEPHEGHLGPWPPDDGSEDGWVRDPLAFDDSERIDGPGTLRPPREEHFPGDGGDSPAWSRHRTPYRSPAGARPTGVTVPYAELHAHSNFSFLDGASHPEELVEEAARLGLEAIALTDHDGMYGVVRFAEAAQELGVPTVYGAELSLGLSAPQNGVPDPEGDHLLVLARDPDGYRAISRAITEGQMHTHGEKGRPVLRRRAGRGDARRARPGAHGVPQGVGAPGAGRGGGGRAPPASSTVSSRCSAPRTSRSSSPTRACPDDTERNAALAGLAAGADRGRGLRTVATTGAHYATPDRARLAAALGGGAGPAQPRRRRGLAAAGAGPPALRGGDGRSASPATPQAVAHAAELGRECAFSARPAGARAAAVRGARGRDRGELAAPADVDGGGAALRRPDALAAGVRGDRARARGHRDAGLPRLLPHRRRHREVLRRS